MLLTTENCGLRSLARRCGFVLGLSLPDFESGMAS